MGYIDECFLIENLSYQGFSGQEITVMQQHARAKGIRFVTPDFVQECSGIIGAAVGLAVKFGTLELIRLGDAAE